MEYISREALPAANMNDNDYADGWNECLEAINAIPAADVRPVVLCKDCKWCHAGYCEKFDDIIPWGVADRPWEEWFCADGEHPNCRADMREEQT